MKAARGRARTPKASRNQPARRRISHKMPLECDASSHRFWALASNSGLDPAEIAFGGSRNGCFCIRKNIRLPPAAINLLE